MVRGVLVIAAMAGVLSGVSAFAADESEGGNPNTLPRRAAAEEGVPRRIAAQPLVGKADDVKPAVTSASTASAAPRYDAPGTPPLEAFMLDAAAPLTPALQADVDSPLRTAMTLDDDAAPGDDSAIFRHIFSTDDGGIVRDYRIDPPFNDGSSRRLTIQPTVRSGYRQGNGSFRIVAVPTYTSSTFVGNANGYYASQTVSYNPGTFVIYNPSGFRYRLAQPVVAPIQAPYPAPFVVPTVVTPPPQQSGVWVQLRF